MDEKKPCEGRSDDTELLKGIYQDAKMGEETLKTLLPQTSLDYFRSPEAGPVLARIRSAGNVVHY